jgi:membrane protein DedA with SNARE-associated domain
VTDVILDHVHAVMTSPWVYAALFALAAIDGFLPVVPSESVVITAGVFAASGGPALPLVITAATAGAIAGDHVSYLVGGASGGRLPTRLPPGSRRRAAFDRAAAVLTERGGLILVVARYVPGGRTAVTMTMGAVGYPLRSFTAYDSIAGLTWGLYSALLGYAGGAAFEDDPAKGLMVGFGLALSVTALTEVVRHLRGRARRRASRTTSAPPAGARRDPAGPAGAPLPWPAGHPQGR